MKYTFIIIVLTLIAGQVGKGQTPINLAAEKYNQSILLKWAPQDYNILEKGLEYGYAVTRYPLIIDTIEYGVDESRDSAVIVASNVNIATPASLTNHNTNATLFAKAMVYDSTMQVTDSLSTASFAKAFEQNREKENRHLFYVAMADQDFTSAKLMGLAFEDDTFQANSTYYYNVCIEYDTVRICSNLVKISTADSISSLTPPYDLEGYGKDSLAVLQWKSEDGQYTFYDIERSVDGVNFSKVNSEPFMFMGMSEEDDITTYQDAMPENHVDYYYRVVGISPFGFNGPYSDTITVKGIPDKLLVELRVDSIHKEEATHDVDVYWRLISSDDPSLVESYIDHFNIIYQKDLKDSIYVLNTSPIHKDERDYTFNAPTTAGYYTLEMFDVNGRQYLSIPHLIQFNDSIPPAVPTGLQGLMDANGQIQLSWDANTEDDLDGYFVYFSYFRDEDYQIMSSEMLSENQYEVRRDPSIHTDSLYFVVTALDNRFNESEYSEVLALKKPDINPPSAPILTIVNPVDGGVRIGWRESQDADVHLFYLCRKLHKATKWDTLKRWIAGTDFQQIEEIFAEKHPVYFIDSADLYLMKYDYRLTAVDSIGLSAHSKVKTITPFDNGIRGQITSEYARGSDCSAYQLGSNNPGGGSSGSNTGISSGTFSKKPISYPCTLLRWDYNTNYPSTLLSFKIYRLDENVPQSGSGGVGTNGNNPTYRLVKTIYKDAAEQVANDFGTNTQYAHIDENGTKPTKDPIKYKIKAEHTDGGVSEWSVEIEVQ